MPVGFRVFRGTPTRWRPSGTATFNPDFDPFDALGQLAVSRFGPEWAGRYCGGDIEATRATPIAGAEWGMFCGGALVRWAELGHPIAALPGGSERVGRNTGAPDDRELTDLMYLDGAFGFIAEMLWYGTNPDEPGKKPENPMPTSRPTFPFVYFFEKHVQFPGVQVFFVNIAPPPGAQRYQRGFPHVHGEGEPVKPVDPPIEPPVKPVDPPTTGKYLSPVALRGVELLVLVGAGVERFTAPWFHAGGEAVQRPPWVVPAIRAAHVALVASGLLALALEEAVRLKRKIHGEPEAGRGVKP